MTIDISQTNSLNLLSHIYTNYETFFTHKNQVSSVVDSRLKEHFKFNSLELIGDIPYYTLYNVMKTRERILQIDEDGIIAVEGEAGSGKTTVALICSFFLDQNFGIPKVLFTFDDLLFFLRDCASEVQKELNDPNYRSNLRGVTVILDEGVFVLFSADAFSKQGKMATKLFTVIRFLNIVMFICMTNFNKVDRTIRETRLYSLIKLVKKGNLTYYSKSKVRQITIDESGTHYPSPNFNEKVGYIKKDSRFWKEYNHKKGSFVSSSINEILEEMAK